MDSYTIRQYRDWRYVLWMAMVTDGVDLDEMKLLVV